MNQAEFLRDAMRRLDMTRSQFADRLAVKTKTLDSWLLPEGGKTTRTMPSMAQKFILEILEKEAKHD